MMVQDPGCMMKIVPQEVKATAELEGKMYYLCSPHCRETFIDQPDLFHNKVLAMRLTVGVMDSAGNEVPEDVSVKSKALGQVIAKRGFVLITGVCPGLPYECARGAQKSSGISIGISPALSLDEHIHK